MQTPVIKSDRYFATGGEFIMEELRGTQDFLLADVEVEVDVMAGKTTNGLAGWGRVLRIMPGVGFEVDNGIQRSVLWSQFWLLEPTLKQMAQTTRSEKDIRRTDSGADYGWPGYPDCAWWEEQGVENPLFVAMPGAYGSGQTGAAGDVLALLREAEDGLEEEGPFRRAWSRQMAAVQSPLSVLASLAAALPPERERCSLYKGPVAASVAEPDPRLMEWFKSQRSAPAAGVRSMVDLLPPHLRPSPLDVRAEEYRGRGIVGFHVPPTEGKTQREFRAALLPAIRAWLTEELPSQAKLASLDCGVETTDLIDGSWPGARLYRLTEETEEGKWPRPPADYGERYYACALWAADVCEKFLTESGFVYAPEAAALDFLRVDRLEDGQTLMDLWNWSRFGPLRDAPPLPDESHAGAPSAASATGAEDEEEEEEESEAEEEEEENDGDGLLGVDLEVVLAKSYTLTLPGWTWAAVAGWLLTYLWMVGFLVGGRR
jgi:hypothetical protein